MDCVQAVPFVSFVLVAICILQRWIIEFKVCLNLPLNDPAHPERSTQESFIQANTDPEPVGVSGMDSSVTSGKGESVRVSFFCLQSLRFCW
ncbi:hypothetical protein [Allobaculum fili]|uniref:hypothetical protein n=1 Tax=Allobaculum fili TaxID=2834460 RepID=UPI001E36AD13|nr:hypothetical protein [Allobaculum fili]